MPEVPEIVMLTNYLNYKLKNRKLRKLEILSGKYVKKGMPNKNLLNTEHKFVKTDSKGKLFWFVLTNTVTDKKLFISSHLGMTGSWRVDNEQMDNDRIRIKLDNDKWLYYNDPRNFGNINIFTENEFDILQTKIDKLAPDALKTRWTDDEFVVWIENCKSRHVLFKVLTDQKLVLSGLGNYLTAEILYKAKLSPYRKLKSLSREEIVRLSKAIKYITKAAYVNNSEGYMEHFEDFIPVFKRKLDNGKYSDYHPEVSVTKPFKFQIYRKNVDKHGYEVKAERKINKDRSTYWVPEIQV